MQIDCRKRSNIKVTSHALIAVEMASFVWCWCSTFIHLLRMPSGFPKEGLYNWVFFICLTRRETSVVEIGVALNVDRIDIHLEIGFICLFSLYLFSFFMELVSYKTDTRALRLVLIWNLLELFVFER